MKICFFITHSIKQNIYIIRHLNYFHIPLFYLYSFWQVFIDILFLPEKKNHSVKWKIEQIFFATNENVNFVYFLSIFFFIFISRCVICLEFHIEKTTTTTTRTFKWDKITSWSKTTTHLTRCDGQSDRHDSTSVVVATTTSDSYNF